MPFSPLRYVLALFTVLPTLLVAGCGMGSVATATSPVTTSISGHLMGGQQPVSGSQIALYNWGTTYGTGQSLLDVATTDGNGNFSINHADYASTCTNNAPLMIVARGGNPGLADGTNNRAIMLSAMLDVCNNVTSATHVTLNEVTTVATAYAMAGFFSQVNYSSYGAPTTNVAGPAIAFQVYNRLVNNINGSSPGASLPAGMVVPTARINSLANALAACVNSAGTTSTPCANLFSYTGVDGTSLAFGNVYVAANRVAQFPNVNVANIFALGGATPPFAPALSAAPPDWSMSLLHTDGQLKQAGSHLAIDSGGDV